MNWEKIENTKTLEEIKELSKNQRILIFKHSTRCSISATALSRLERAWKEEEMGDLKPYFLDLINYREVSNQIASDFLITHQSPQVIVIENEQAIYDNSHLGISYQALKELLS